MQLTSYRMCCPPSATQVYVTREELQAIKGVGETGITLLGFKPQRQELRGGVETVWCGREGGRRGCWAVATAGVQPQRQARAA